MSFWPHVLVAALLFATIPAHAQDLVIPPGTQNPPPGNRAAPGYTIAQNTPATAPKAKPQRKSARRATTSEVVPATTPPDIEQPPAQRAEPSSPGDRATASEIDRRVAGTGLNDPLMAKYYAEGWRPASAYPNVIDHLPFTLYASQTVSYNDNLLLLPNGAVPPPGQSRSDLYSLTTIGASTRIPVGAQHLFFDGTYGITRYRKNDSLDSENYLVNGGLDWVFTSRCAGRLIATARQVQSPMEELTSFSNNNVKTVSAKETAKCSVADHVNVIADSGVSRTTNSLGSLTANDYDQYYLRGGLEYSLAELNTIGAKVTYTKSDYFNRSPLTNPGLATDLEQTEYALYLRRFLTPKLEFDGSLGFTESTATSPTLSSSFTKPTYSATLRWFATPKLLIAATTAASVSPAQTIVADYQRVRTDSVSATYLYSPKLSFTAAVGQAHLSNPTSSGVAVSPFLREQKSYYTEFRTNYQITPLTSAMFQYRYTNRKDEILDTESTSNLFMVGLNYRR